MKHKFYKDENNNWFIFLPEYPGQKEELQMVDGADTMLDIISQGEDEVSLFLSLEQFDGSYVLEHKRDAEELGNGAYYVLNEYQGISFELEMWLCDVTKFVFGYFPKMIYFCRS